MIADSTHDPALTSWVATANGHPDFPIQNLPLGLFSPPDGGPRVGVAIGDSILDLGRLARDGLLAMGAGDLAMATLLQPGPRGAIRAEVSALLARGGNQAAVLPALHDAARCTMHLPLAIGDYTDFYVGIHHATNVGRIFRPGDPLLANYKHVPIGYHGRASSIRVSGTPVRRPRGQIKPPQATAPEYLPTRRLDYELELGVWIGAGSSLGTPVPIGAAPAYVGGYCLLNDWSARDIQAWEYQPLGPFLGKNFATTLSPWIVTPEALAPFAAPQQPRPAGDPHPLPYLWGDADQQEGALAIDLQVLILTPAMQAAGQAPQRLGASHARHMYWTVAQMIAHHTSGGCDLRAGDLLGTGTLSAPDPSGCGSLLEASQGGTVAVQLTSGEHRLFVEDGDTVILRAQASRPGAVTIGFGDCTAQVLPAG